MRPHGNRKTTHRIAMAMLGIALLAGGPALAVAQGDAVKCSALSLTVIP